MTQQLINNLTLSEYEELHQGSGIHPDLIALNFRHLDGDAALDRFLISDRLARRNTGAISYSVLNCYRHVIAGGWWVSGVDVQNNYRDDLWGQFKPTRPRLSADKGKLIKYEAPPKYPTGIIALKVSDRLWRSVAKRNKTKLFLSALSLRLRDRTHPLTFWEWVVLNPHIPLIITEGAKKAAALVSLGYAAIALPGIFNGYRQPKNELGKNIGLAKLIPQLQVFASLGRDLYFAFDRDTKPSTIANVKVAISKTGKLLTQAGANVKVIRWLEPAKGVDDLIVNYGAEAFERAYNGALSLEAWSIQTQVQLTYPANIRVNRRYLGSLREELGDKETGGDEGIENIDSVTPSPRHSFDGIIEIPDSANFICLNSSKGTGKTYLLEQVVDKAISQGKWVLLLTHRIQLGEALCQRVGLPYINEIHKVEFGSVLGYGLCIDSLHPNSSARFNADNWQDGVVIIDEVEQVIWHLLNSDTCTAERVEILSQFKTLIQNTLSGDGRVYLADADLSDVAIDYIRSLAGFHVEPFVIVNDWRPSEDKRWTVHNYEDKNPAHLVRDLIRHIEAGGKPMVCCSAQKIKSKWGTQNLECYLQLKFPRHKILRIDSQTVADPTHPAYGCIAHLNEVLPHYDIVIASPSIETGVSIECQRQEFVRSQIPLAFQFLLQTGIPSTLGRATTVPHFTSVWAIAQGIQAADSIRQALARIRANVPRYLWAAKRGFYKSMVGNGAISKKALLANTKNKARTNIQLLQAADASVADLDLDSDFQPESLNTWAKRGCYINLTMQHYRTSIVEGLIAEGHRVVAPPVFPVEEDAKVESTSFSIEAQLKQVALTQYQGECTHISDAIVPSDSKYQKLKYKRAKTPQERWQERKGHLVRRYGESIPITPELVAKDDEGWYSQLLSHYYLTVGKLYLIERDLRHLKSIAASHKNRLWLPDLNRSLLSTSLRMLETLIIGLLQPGVQWQGSHPNLQLIAELARANQREIKTFLGITLAESDSPIKIAQKLLSILGLKLTCIGRLGSRECRERVYIFEPPNDGRDEIFAGWLSRDLAFASTRSTNLTTSDSSDVELSSVSTKGKNNNLTPAVDIEQETDTKSNEEQKQTQISFIQPGAIVEWFKQRGQWIVRATTGAIAKIKNLDGTEVLVNTQELKIYFPPT